MADYLTIYEKEIEEAAATFGFELRQYLEAPGPTAIELPLGTGARTRWEYDDLNLSKTGIPVGPMPSVTELPLRDINAAIRGTLKSGGEDAFRLHITRDAAVWWKGQVSVDLFRASLDLFDHTARLSARCGLARLKGLAYDNAGTPYADDSRVPVSTLIIQLLALTGLQLNVHIVSNRYPYHPTTPVTGNPLRKVEVDRGRFTRYTSAGEAQSPNAYEVLKSLCYDHELQIFQYENAWHVVERAEKETGTYTAYIYDYQAAAVGTQAVDPLLYSWTTLNQAQNDGVFIKGGQRGDAPALRSASVKYNHGEIGGELLKNPSFEGAEAWVSNTEPADWTRTCTDGAALNTVFLRGAKPHGEGVSSAVIKGRSISLQNIDAGANPEDYATRHLSQVGPTVAAGTAGQLRLLLNAYVDIEGSETVANIDTPRLVYWAFQLGVKWITQTSNGHAWSDSMVLNRIGSGAVIRDWVSEEVLLDLHADGGTPTLYLYNVVETWILDGSTESYSLLVHWDDLSMRIEPENEESNIEATVFQAVVEDSDASIAASELVTVFGDGPTALQKGRYTHLDGSLTESWKIGPYAAMEAPYEYDTGLTLTHGFLAAAMRLRQQSVPLEMLEVSFKIADIGEGGPRHVLAETNSGQRFEPVRLTRYYGIGERGRVEGTWLELSLDAVWPTEIEYHDQAGPRTFGSGNAAARILGLRNDSLLNQLDALGFTKTTGNHLVAGNPHSVLNVEAITGNHYADLRPGTLIHIVDRRGLGRKVYTARLTDYVPQDETQIPIEDPDNPGTGISFDFNLSPGSYVYKGNAELLASISFTELFYASQFRADVVAYLNEDIVGGTRLSIDVDDELGGGSLHKVFDNNSMILYPTRSDGTVGEPVEFFMRSDEAAGSTNWLIDDGAGGQVSIPDALTGSPIKFNASSRGTEISQNSAEVLLRAYEDDVVQTLFELGGSAYTRVRSLSSGGTTLVYVDALPEALPGNARVRFFVPKDFGEPDGPRGPLGLSFDRFVIPAGAPKGQDYFYVTSNLPYDVTVGSLVYYDFGEVVTRILDNEAQIAVSAGEILSLVSSRENAASFTITTAYNGTFRTSIQISGLESGAVLKEGDEFQIERLSDGTRTRCRVRNDLTGSGGTQTLDIDGTNVYSDSGSPCFLGSLAQTRLTLDGMQFDVQKISSGNYNGTVASGLITSPGSAGWALTEGGHLQVAQDINNYLLYNASGLIARFGANGVTLSDGGMNLTPISGFSTGNPNVITWGVEASIGARTDGQGFLDVLFNDGNALVNAYLSAADGWDILGDVLMDDVAVQSLRSSGGLQSDGDFIVDDDLIFADVSLGRVGINDSTPSYALDVTGDVRATNRFYLGTGGAYIQFSGGDLLFFDGIDTYTIQVV